MWSIGRPAKILPESTHRRTYSPIGITDGAFLFALIRAGDAPYLAGLSSPAYISGYTDTHGAGATVLTAGIRSEEWYPNRSRPNTHGDGAVWLTVHVDSEDRTYHPQGRGGVVRSHPLC